jgi:hypothetical protein
MTLADPAPIPGGELQDGPGGPGERESEAGTRALAGCVRDWVHSAPAERAPLLAIPVLWVAADLLHLFHAPWLGVIAVALVAAGFAGWIGERRQPAQAETPAGDAELLPGQEDQDGGAAGDPDDGEPGAGESPEALLARPKSRLGGVDLASAAIGTGLWTGLAAKLGAAGGPDHFVGLLYLAGAAGGYWWLRVHPAVREARARRDAAELLRLQEAARVEADENKRAWWRAMAQEADLGGSHLLNWDATNLGEEWHINTHGVKLASQVDPGLTAQKLAGERGMRSQMVEVRPDGDWPYLLHILWRKRDPWAGGSLAGVIWHPWKSGSWDPQIPYADLVPPTGRSITKPMALGADPETGEPLMLQLWSHEEGARRVGVIARSGMGKSSLLNTIKEGVTACADARLIQVNLDKAAEEGWWDELAIATARTKSPEAAARAGMIFDFAVRSFSLRSDAPKRQAGAPEHVPTPEEPVFVLVVDEADAVAMTPDHKKALDMISGKCRSEGWVLIVAAQRAVLGWISPAIRANLTHWLIGVMRPGEASAAGTWLPDMNAYARGTAGVFGLLPNPTYQGMEFSRGRVFFWGKPVTGLLRLIADRVAAQVPFQLEPALAPLRQLWDAITGKIPASELAATEARYDVATTPDGQTVTGVQQLTDRLAAVKARVSGAAPPPAPAGQRPRAADGGRWGDEWRTPISPEHQEHLRQLVCRPGGVSSRSAAAQLLNEVGRPAYSHQTINKQLQWWRDHGGLVGKKGSGPFSHWEAVPGKAWLRSVPGQGGQDAAPIPTAVPDGTAREPGEAIAGEDDPAGPEELETEEGLEPCDLNQDELDPGEEDPGEEDPGAGKFDDDYSETGEV